MSDVPDRLALGAYLAKLSSEELAALASEARRRENEPTDVRATFEAELRARRDPEGVALIEARLAEPEVTDANAWPTLDPAALYGLPGEVVATIRPESESDPAAVLVNFLTAFGAAAGPGWHAVAESDAHPARLNVVLVGETAKARKGSSWSNVRRVMAAADPEFVAARIMSGFGSGEALVDEVKDGEDRRLLVVENEFSRILRVNKREGSVLSTVLRDAWDGRSLQARSRKSTVVAPEAHVCLLGHITVEELRAELTEIEIANGLGNRHLFVCARRSKLLPGGGNLDDRTVAKLGAKVRARLDDAHKGDVWAVAAGGAQSLVRAKPRILRRSEEAERWWSQQLYAEMARDEPGGLLGAIIARDAAQVLRLSVAYALTDGARQITLPHLEAAWALWSYCRQSAAFIFGGRVGDDVSDRLLEELEAIWPAGLDRTAQHALFGRNYTARRLAVARELLVSRGLADEEVEQSPSRPPRTVLRARRTPYEIDE